MNNVCCMSVRSHPCNGSKSLIALLALILQACGTADAPADPEQSAGSETSEAESYLVSLSVEEWGQQPILLQAWFEPLQNGRFQEGVVRLTALVRDGSDSARTPTGDPFAGSFRYVQDDLFVIEIVGFNLWVDATPAEMGPISASPVHLFGVSCGAGQLCGTIIGDGFGPETTLDGGSWAAVVAADLAAVTVPDGCPSNCSVPPIPGQLELGLDWGLGSCEDNNVERVQLDVWKLDDNEPLVFHACVSAQGWSHCALDLSCDFSDASNLPEGVSLAYGRIRFENVPSGHAGYGGVFVSVLGTADDGTPHGGQFPGFTIRPGRIVTMDVPFFDGEGFALLCRSDEDCREGCISDCINGLFCARSCDQSRCTLPGTVCGDMDGVQVCSLDCGD